MTIFEILNFNKEIIDRLVSVGFKLEDSKYVPLYADYIRMYENGEKVTYIVSLLSERYKVSERKIYKILKRFDTDCKLCAV